MLKDFSLRSVKAIILVDQAVVSGASFVSNILIAHAIGITAYGTFSMVVLFQIFLLSIQQSVLSGIYQVSLGRFTETVQKKYSNGLFYLQASFLLVLLIAGLLIAVSHLTILNAQQHILLPGILTVTFFLLQDYLRKILITGKKESKALIIDAITNGLQLMLLGICAVMNRLNLPLALWITGLTFIPSLIAGIIWTAPGLPVKAAFKFTFRWHRDHCGWLFLSAVLQWSAGNFFVIAAGWWLGLAAFGALRLAQFIIGILNVLLQAVENYALPKSVLLASNDDDFNRFLQNILRKAFLVVTPFLILMTVFAKQLLYASGGAVYTPYTYVIYCLAAIYLVIVVGLPVRIALRVQLLNKYYFTGYALATAFSLSCARWMIHQWALVGVLAGIFITQGIVVGYWLYILHNKKIIQWKLYTSY